ncbi:MAG: NAD(P)-dependent oxidoreductase [Burkholderiaceae bacterium]
MSQHRPTVFPSIQDKLNQALEAATQFPEVREELQAQGIEPAYGEGFTLMRSGLRLGISRDFLAEDGSSAMDPQALASLHSIAGIEIEMLEQPAQAPITRADLYRYDALMIKRNPVDAALFGAPAAGTLRLRLLARNGVGFDHIAVDACTAAGVMVCTTPDAVARPVASSIMAMMLAFSHRLLPRDRATRQGRWSERWNQAGLALTGRTLGVVGLGNIGLELLRLALPWEMRHLGTTPRVDMARYAGLRVEPVALDVLLTTSDFVAMCCPLNESTRGLIDARALARMQPQAVLINTARGEVVDEPALVDALRNGRIAGAGIDVFAQEPPAGDNPLFGLDNVILGSHNLAYSDELNSKANRACAAAIGMLAANRPAPHLVNPRVLAHPRLAELLS